MSAKVITRTRAMELLRQNIANDKMIAHCLASEVVMRALAKKLNEDEEEWAITGLLHDLDVELTADTPHIHGAETVKMLEQELVTPEMLDAIRMHNEEATGLERSTKFQHALACGETITGLIFATTLVYPDKKLASVKPKSVVKRMKEKHFAASVKRENILECEKLGIPIQDFAVLAIDAMKTISDDLGL